MKKCISILAIIIMLISLNVNISLGANITEAYLYSKGGVKDLLMYNGIEVYTTIVVYSNDGVEYPAYCVNKDLPGVGENGPYTVSTSNLSNVMIWRALINGYPYKSCAELGCSNEGEAYMATKQAIYCIIYNRDTSGYSAIDEAGQRCLNALNQIVNAARNSSETKISSELYINEINTDWNMDSLDNSYVSKEFTVTSNAGFSEYIIYIEGEFPEGTKIVDLNNKEKNNFSYNEKFKIIMPIKNVSKDGNFTIKAQGKVKTKPVLYGASGNSSLQDYALATSMLEDGDGKAKVYYTKNNTNIVIVKKDNKTNEFLQGVKFNLLDENKNIIYTELETNENGEIRIENLLPGKYYIQEIRTLAGYSIYDKLIKVDISLNETAKFNINNEKTEVIIEEEKIETETTVINKQKEVTLPVTGY
ncbi:MAG: Cys-Gln thioester bond-forming surface protein [Clostridia bacterium]|nr:Cys-Gln thioester bond-forming surface protein [Clostridia bacterium]